MLEFVLSWAKPTDMGSNYSKGLLMMPYLGWEYWILQWSSSARRVDHWIHVADTAIH